MSTPVAGNPRLSQTMASMTGIDADERALAEQLQAALAPSFVLIRRLGAGGMGVVYLARDPMLKRLVAVKLMSPGRAADPEARARFEREAEAVAAISHPNVVAVHSVGELPNGLPYLVMQYVEGPSMAERLADEGPLDLESAKQILGHVASALAAAHRKGIIHRDIKAANILWDDRAGRALVSDFGIAGILEPDFDTGVMRLTQTGVVMGTPRYMSPEQLLSEPVTEKTDIYSLGLLGYELLTGESPYKASSPNEIVAAHLRDVPRPLSVMRPDVDPELESLLAACLEKDAHGRPSAEDVARRLQRGASVLLEWPPPGLEEMQGAAAKPLSYLLVGGLAIATPLVLATVAVRGSMLRFAWPQALILPTIATVGGLAVALGAVDAFGLFRLAMRAARAGYGWVTIGEVLVDEQRNAGALMTGEREFAALSPVRRVEFRRARLIAAALTAGAGIWPLFGFFVMLPAASRLGSPFVLAFGTLGIPAVMLIAARVLAIREARALRGIRAKLRGHGSPLEKMANLAATWRDSFDRWMEGVRLGQGSSGRIARKVAAVAGITVLAAAGVFASYGLMTFGLLGEVAETFAAPQVNNIQERARQIERLRSLRPPVDPSITPLRAGQALQSILRTGVKAEPLESPVAYPLAQPVVPKAWRTGAPFGEGSPTRAWDDATPMKEATHGLTAEQRRFLEERAKEPGEAEVALLGRAAKVDYLSAGFIQPFPYGTNWALLPTPRYSRLRTAVEANLARAALDAANGRPAIAERRLRDNIGAGFALLEGTTALENLFGRAMVNAARTQLVALYEATGRAAEARQISTATDPLPDEVARQPFMSSMKPNERDAYVQAIIRDSTKLRGLRWQMVVAALAFQPCTDIRQVIFGVDSIHVARLAEARRVLVRSSGEDALMRLAEQALDRPMSANQLGPQSVGTRSLRTFARTVDALSGSRRMESCILGGISWDRPY